MSLSLHQTRVLVLLLTGIQNTSAMYLRRAAWRDRKLVLWTRLDPALELNSFLTRDAMESTITSLILWEMTSSSKLSNLFNEKKVTLMKLNFLTRTYFCFQLNFMENIQSQHIFVERWFMNFNFSNCTICVCSCVLLTYILNWNKHGNKVIKICFFKLLLSESLFNPFYIAQCNKIIYQVLTFWWVKHKFGDYPPKHSLPFYTNLLHCYINLETCVEQFLPTYK